MRARLLLARALVVGATVAGVSAAWLLADGRSTADPLGGVPTGLVSTLDGQEGGTPPGAQVATTSSDHVAVRVEPLLSSVDRVADAQGRSAPTVVHSGFAESLGLPADPTANDQRPGQESPALSQPVALAPAQQDLGVGASATSAAMPDAATPPRIAAGEPYRVGGPAPRHAMPSASPVTGFGPMGCGSPGHVVWDVPVGCHADAMRTHRLPALAAVLDRPHDAVGESAKQPGTTPD